MDYITPDLCDAYPDKVRVVAAMINGCQFRNYGGRRSFGGEIITIKCFEDNSLVKEHAANPGHGKVMVVDGGGSLRKALLGDMIAENAVNHGWEGIIIYGCVRDVDAIGGLDLGVQALATIPLKTEKRGIGDYAIPLEFGGVTFNPREYIYADNNGIVVSETPLVMPK